MEDKIGKTQIYNIRNERGNIIKDSEVMKRIRKYHKQFYSDKFDNLDKMDIILQRHKQQKFIKKK